MVITNSINYLNEKENKHKQKRFSLNHRQFFYICQSKCYKPTDIFLLLNITNNHWRQQTFFCSDELFVECYHFTLPIIFSSTRLNHFSKNVQLVLSIAPDECNQILFQINSARNTLDKSADSFVRNDNADHISKLELSTQNRI